MLYRLSSSLHQEDLFLAHEPDKEFVQQHQVVLVLTGGTEALFVELVNAGKISLTETIFLLATGQSNSLAASLEILSWIHLHHGHGEIRCDW